MIVDLFSDGLRSACESGRHRRLAGHGGMHEKPGGARVRVDHQRW
ncbi:hypothetical protein QCE64_01050 [Caballeronia sp. LZ043]|nr:hypothetical protein [Caballeronia sp. LZ032]MDR5812262.1 hypothetical protein [Caballeronia sp. LZ033]MDR5819087.1 hypothetical protein [Caballeronia sp. LZ043]MDR5876885.1 hypothetical protein [Caballeronia sp. LZ032]